MKQTRTWTYVWALAALALAALAAAAESELVRVQLVEPRADLAKLAGMQFDIAGVNRERATADLVLREGDAARLIAAGFVFEPLPPLPEKIDSQYLDVLEIEQLLQQYATSYPALAQVWSLGTGHTGNEVYCIKISDNVAADEDEPEMFFNSSIHAREVMTPEITLDMVAFLLEGYGSDPLATSIVDDFQTFIVPHVNPDGTRYCWEQDNMWRKNRRNNGSSYGVDCNRNFPYMWGACNGSSGSGWDDTYRGPSAGSEPETQAILSLLEAGHRPIFAISYHSYSELVLLPYGCEGDYTPEDAALRSVANGVAARIVRDSGSGGYTPGTSWETLYAVDGGDIDTLYHHYGVFAYVIEVNSDNQGFQPSYNSWRNSTVQRNRPGWQYLYERVAGPSIWGHTTDACTGQPITASVSLTECPMGSENARTSNTHGRYHRIVVPGTYHVTFQAAGYNPLTVEITVGSSAFEVNATLVPVGERAAGVAGVAVEDAAGDGDATLDPGETALLRVRAAALGAGLSQVTAMLSSSDPQVVVVDGELSFGAIAAGSSVECIECPVVAILPGCPENHRAVFELEFSAAEALCATGASFALPVSSYVYECPVMEEPLDVNPNWTIQNTGSGGWAFGTPSNGPGSAHTGQYVYATNLSGNYGNNGTFRLTTTPFDCSELADTELRFWRWLHNETGYDLALVEVSGDGSNWTEVWSGYASDTAWSEQVLDVSGVADGQSAVRFRFSLLSDSYLTYQGFYLDDVSICGRVPGDPIVPTPTPTGGPATPTPTATAGPGDTPTPTPPPSPTPDPEAPVLDLLLADAHLTGGELFLLERAWANPGPETRWVDEYIMLDVFGEYWFYPDWTPAVDKVAWILGPESQSRETILRFVWPSGAGSLEGVRFWGAFFAANSFDLVAYDMVEWGFAE